MLVVKGLHAFYGKSHILHGIDLSIERGEIVSLLGRNGTGRSTLVKALIGLVSRTGSVRFNEAETIRMAAFRIARLGIGYVPENRDVFPTLTVRQNLVLGEKPGRPPGRWQLDEMFDFFPRLKERENTPAGFLSGGEQQMLTLCRTLMGNPDFIMIDEPTEGVAPKIVAQIRDLLLEVKRRQVSVLLIEQKLDIALDLCNRLYLMGHGEIVFEGTAAQLSRNPDLQKEWLEV
ncbi:ABC transporter ATP-binding protein [Castellaniella sp.]|uniref:ABC transporter ATP-binding protein n=1 Tax=Castellaniella sp. TaxID=1955812 RepID=UPI002AFEFA99|nr:ABC transporter ATP-binding protein [Castellaniella sp.]